MVWSRNEGEELGDQEMSGATSRFLRRDRTGRRGRFCSGLAVFVCLIAILQAFGCATTTPAPDEVDQVVQAAAIRDVGIDHLAKGHTAMAIRKLQHASKLDPTDPITSLSLGESYRRKGLLDRAEQHLLHSLELNPDSTDLSHQETVLSLCALYIQLKRFAAARVQCQKLVDDPTYSSPWRALTNRGWAEFKQGELAAARGSFGQAIDFHPRYSPAHLNLGILERHERHPLPAIRHFESALEGKRLAPDGVAEANYRMAEIYVSLGNRGKAIEHFSVALERSPYGQWGSQSKSYLELLR